MKYLLLIMLLSGCKQNTVIQAAPQPKVDWSIYKIKVVKGEDLTAGATNFTAVGWSEEIDLGLRDDGAVVWRLSGKL